MKYRLYQNKVTGARSALIVATGEMVKESDDPASYADIRKKRLASVRNAGRAEAYRSCGMVRVVGEQGGVYWE